mmetsp:Transcript_15007/g.46686  ORF Transcript_15007/g.46686 Transcript_15007/m.46686 type:complete len:235 (+) Transcript_15007:231-935(+)
MPQLSVGSIHSSRHPTIRPASPASAHAPRQGLPLQGSPSAVPAVAVDGWRRITSLSLGAGSALPSPMAAGPPALAVGVRSSGWLVGVGAAVGVYAAAASTRSRRELLGPSLATLYFFFSASSSSTWRIRKEASSSASGASEASAGAAAPTGSSHQPGRARSLARLASSASSSLMRRTRGVWMSWWRCGTTILLLDEVGITTLPMSKLDVSLRGRFLSTPPDSAPFLDALRLSDA